MKKDGKITNTTFLATAVIGIFFILLMEMATALWASRKTVTATEEAVSAVSSFYLEAMADRRAKTITNLINNNFDEMEKALAYIDSEQCESQDELRSAIGTVKSILSLKRFALADEDNIVYTQYTTYTGGSRYGFLSEEKMEDRVITTVSVYGSSKQLCLAAPTPGLIIMGKPFKACFVQIDITDIFDLLAIDDQGKTYYGVYSRSGENLSDTEMGPPIGRQNIIEAIKDAVSENDWNEIRDNFENGTEGNITFTSQEAAETLCYVPVQGTGWEMAVLIRESVIYDEIHDISEKNLATSRNQIIFTLAAVLLLAAILLLELRLIAKNKLEAEKNTSRAFHNMANTDSMTGVRNRHAYSEMEAVINQKIRDHEIGKLGIVICDINGLKRVNDTQGHAAGDALIKEACSLICGYFTHGAVFRVGGDEFAVVLQGDGCDTMMEVISEFNRTVENNIKENAIVVSLGFAELEKEDRQLRDLFERADQLMYARKKELKEMEAQAGRE